MNSDSTPFSTAQKKPPHLLIGRSGSIRSHSKPPITYVAATTARTELKDPNLEASQAAETADNIPERLEPVFMKELAVAPNRPPISTQLAHAAGNIRS